MEEECFEEIREIIKSNWRVAKRIDAVEYAGYEYLRCSEKCADSLLENDYLGYIAVHSCAGSYRTYGFALIPKDFKSIRLRKERKAKLDKYFH